MEPTVNDLVSRLSMWADAPLADPDKVIEKIRRTQSAHELKWLNEWIDRQQTCSVIARYHGSMYLHAVLRAIASASVAAKVSMSGRVQSICDYYEMGE